VTSRSDHGSRGFDVFKKPARTGTFDVKRTPRPALHVVRAPDTTEVSLFRSIKEEGDLISLQPGAVKFKKGLTCCAGRPRRRGSPSLPRPQDHPSRIDLKKVKSPPVAKIVLNRTLAGPMRPKGVRQDRMAREDDWPLVRRVVDREELAAFDMLVERYQDRIYGRDRPPGLGCRARSGI